MDHHHTAADARLEAKAAGISLNRLAFTATVHCLSGCAIGEVLGLVIGTALAGRKEKSLPKRVELGEQVRQLKLTLDSTVALLK